MNQSWTLPIQILLRRYDDGKALVVNFVRKLSGNRRVDDAWRGSSCYKEASDTYYRSRCQKSTCIAYLVCQKTYIALLSVFHKEKMVLLLYYSSSGRITFIGNGLIIQSRGNPSSTSKQDYSWTLTMHNIPEKKTGYGCRYIIGNATKWSSKLCY